MYNKLSASYQKKLHNFEDEPPEKKLISDADVLIKQLGEKQRNTKTNLKELLALKKDFYKATEFMPLTSYTSGASSLEEFNSIVKSSEEVEKLKSCDLTDEEINLLSDYTRGPEYFKSKHKNINDYILKDKLNHIFQQIAENINKDIKNSADLGRHEKELILSEKPTSMETKLLKFVLENQCTLKEKLPHPMDSLKDIEKQFITSTNVNVNKIKRKTRSLQKKIDTMNTSELVDPIVKHKKAMSLSENSKWDKKYTESNEVKNAPKIYTCKPQNYYTIRDNQIVKIDKLENKNTLEDNTLRKLTLEEIKKLPKFENYSPGEPSSILYLKNLANGLTEDDLMKVFNESTNEKISSLKIMKGKMRGQAFVEMENETAAQNVLNQCNGVLVKNKPIIIQFGKGKNG